MPVSDPELVAAAIFLYQNIPGKKPWINTDHLPGSRLQKLRVRTMSWPDGGQSDLCTDCLGTRHHCEFDTTEWQDHGYKTPRDWYFEAAQLQHDIDQL